MTKACYLLMLVLAAGVAPAAVTYRWVDAQGVHYSDQPHQGAEKVTLAQPQTYASTPAPASGPRPAGPAPAAAPFRYEGCAVVQPANDEVLFDPQAVTLRAQTTPAPRPGDRVTLTIDGANLEAPNAGQLEFRIEPIERGTHSVAVSVRDAAGRALCQSSTVSFHVRQPSQLAPLNPNNPANRPKR